MTKSPRPPLPRLPRSFTAIDFETANEFERASACAVAVVVVEDNHLVAQKSWLINPQTRFSAVCVAIHGITARRQLN
jgi:DNA polymerase-3 subunit epsilon